VLWAFVLTAGFMGAEVAGGLLSGSLALLADAAHMLTDAASLALAWCAFRIARRPADPRRSYGYHRGQVLAAFVNGAVLVAIVAWIFIEAVQRLMNPVPVEGGLMLGVAALGLAVNVIAFLVLHGGDRENLNMRGAAAHVLGDLLGSAAAIAGALVILWTGWTPIDPILSMLVGLLVLRSAWMVVRESFAKGAEACRPFVARRGLSDVFVDPALEAIQALGGETAFGKRLRALAYDAARVTALDFGDHKVAVAPGEAVVLALPPGVAGDLVPDLAVPRDARPIVNAHIRLPEGARPARTLAPELPILGLVGGAADWLFLRDDVVSLTVSAADELAEQPAEAIGALMWRDTAKALGLDPALIPVIRIIKEKRATLAQTPAALKLRPGPRTRWGNLALAGDWTDTGYPATIDSAVRSGGAAAALFAKP